MKDYETLATCLRVIHVDTSLPSSDALWKEWYARREHDGREIWVRREGPVDVTADGGGSDMNRHGSRGR